MKTLPEILSECVSATNVSDGKGGVFYDFDFIQAQEAIAKELMGCLPENVNVQELMSANIEVEHEVYNIEFSKGFNKALDEVRARLTAFIGKEQ